MAARSESLDTSGRELVISREFHAPVAAVWKAWTDATQLANWWGPKEMKLEVLKADIRAGGCFHYAMKSPGHTMFGLSIYRELVAPSRLVWVNSFADEKGNVARAFFSKDFPLEVLNTVTLTEKGARTLLNLRSAPINATPADVQRALPVDRLHVRRQRCNRGGAGAAARRTVAATGCAAAHGRRDVLHSRPRRRSD